MAEIQLYVSMAETQLSFSMVQPQNPNSLVGPQLLNTMVETQLLHTMVGPHFNCLPLRQTTQLSVYIVHYQLSIDVYFKIFKFSGPSLSGMMLFTLQPRFLSGVYYDNCVCHILCAQA